MSVRLRSRSSSPVPSAKKQKTIGCYRCCSGGGYAEYRRSRRGNNPNEEWRCANALRTGCAEWVDLNRDWWLQRCTECSTFDYCNACLKNHGLVRVVTLYRYKEGRGPDFNSSSSEDWDLSSSQEEYGTDEEKRLVCPDCVLFETVEDKNHNDLHTSNYQQQQQQQEGEEDGWNRP